MSLTGTNSLSYKVSGAHGEEDAILLTMMDKENMEAMAQDVVECISNAKFGEAYILACRGVRREQYAFDDEQLLRTFLALTEERKNNFQETYRPCASDTLCTTCQCVGS